ncbi:hypothetical protein Godav_014081 [Gossypium davidsonii]|uniref:Uncharacterized protein n=1 Tax=Gossypium davidsonii TaxID=34287 RepID=A0A7J8RJI7_GOSDV|nr:hypothetical protein [Gossypium davidsonii]
MLATKYPSLTEWLKVSANVKSYLNNDKGELWVAEGIVSSKQEEEGEGKIAEDVAEGYLLELAERCMIQVRERDIATLKIRSFQMHDLMRDVCLSKAKQQKFLYIADQSNASQLSTIGRVRRVSAHKFFWIQCIKSLRLRSLLFFDEFLPNDEMEKVLPLRMRSYFENHEYEYHNPLVWFVVLFGLSVLANDIGELIHLRFLRLRGLYFLSSKLPSSLGNLRCLQTLDLRIEGGYSNSIHVPNVLWRMQQLRHLYLPKRCSPKTKLKLGTLRSLQTLVNFNTKSCYIKDLINMTNIRELEIRGPFNIEDFNTEELGKNPLIVQSKYLHSLSIINYEEGIDPRHLAHLLSSCDSISKLSLDDKVEKVYA